MAYKYPNLAAEMARTGTDYGALYDEVAKNTGRAGELPTKVAFAIRDAYFPALSIDYLFSETPIVDYSGATKQTIIE